MHRAPDADAPRRILFLATHRCPAESPRRFAVSQGRLQQWHLNRESRPGSVPGRGWQGSHPHPPPAPAGSERTADCDPILIPRTKGRCRRMCPPITALDSAVRSGPAECGAGGGGQACCRSISTREEHDAPWRIGVRSAGLLLRRQACPLPHLPQAMIRGSGRQRCKGPCESTNRRGLSAGHRCAARNTMRRGASASGARCVCPHHGGTRTAPALGCAA